MANSEQLKILDQGVDVWNNWRVTNSSIKIDLSKASFGGVNLKEINLSGANLFGADLSRADLSEADISEAVLGEANLEYTNLMRANLFKSYLRDANLEGANLKFSNMHSAFLADAILKGVYFNGANLGVAHLNGSDLSAADLSGAYIARSFLYRAILWKANLNEADLREAHLHCADFSEARLFKANLQGADLYGANLSGADLSGANLKNSNLNNTICVQTNFTKSNIENASVYGISIWDIKKNKLCQKNLKITKSGEPDITVDNLEVAQFIYLMLNNEKIRDVLGTIAKKGVLILGRFTAERKKVLDAIRNMLREFDFVPMMFDFEKVTERDFTETIKILAGMSRFVIVDITNPSSSPLELQATLPDYKIPFVPIIQSNEKEFAMFKDLTIYPWVIDLQEYNSEGDLLKYFKEGIIDQALAMEKNILSRKLLKIRRKNIRDSK